METTAVYFIALTVFAMLVARRASKLFRSPWAWGIAAWLISPLLVWIILEISGRKKSYSLDEAEIEEEGGYAEEVYALPEN